MKRITTQSMLLSFCSCFSFEYKEYYCLSLTSITITRGHKLIIKNIKTRYEFQQFGNYRTYNSIKLNHKI